VLIFSFAAAPGEGAGDGRFLPGFAPRFCQGFGSETMSNSRNFPFIFASLFVALTAAPVVASNEFFKISALSTGGAAAGFDQSGNLFHVTGEMLQSSGPFSSLSSQAFNSTLAYGPVYNAITFSENAAHTSVTLAIPLTGYSQTFTGFNSADLQLQVQSFFQTNQNNAYAQLLQALDQQSPLALFDGNPQAATALVASDAFTRFGMQNFLSTEPKQAGNGIELNGDFSGGGTHAGENAWYAQASFESAFRFTNHFAFSTATMLEYRNLSSSETYVIAQELATPITILLHKGDGVSWMATPWAFGAFAVSYDQAAGSFQVGGGGTSDFALHMGSVTVTLADQISYASNIKGQIRGYNFDTPVNQWILKNGADVAVRIPETPTTLDVGLAYSNFLRKAAIPSYWTPTAGLNVNFDQFSGLRIAANADLALKYTNVGGELQVYFLQ
jgi:hypothetical protein